MILKRILFLLVLVLFPMYSFAADIDSTSPGPHEVGAGEYRLPANIDPDILPSVSTEIWAKVFYPKDYMRMASPLPLIMMLHGNHPTCGFGSNPRLDNNCEYTHTGQCPDGYITVPNHEGYNYLARNLASWGFWVVTINANRGINCGSGQSGDWGLNLARGRLVLKHLSLLSKWASIGAAPDSLGLGPQGLIGKIDFNAVGLFGHSRGGEGMRAAYNLYRDPDSIWTSRIPNLNIRAIFEVGAVDGQTSRILDATDIIWNQLLPLCDGDVSNLEGRYPFERMLLNRQEHQHAQKSLYEVWGANHNFFNTEWQISDNHGCMIGTPIFDPSKSYSLLQQKIALASVPAFFRSHLGEQAEPVFNRNFNPLQSLPKVVNDITQVDREFTASPAAAENIVLDDFNNETGINSSGEPNQFHLIDMEHKYLIRSKRLERVVEIKWDKSGEEHYFVAIFTPEGQGVDLHDYATLDFRVGRTFNDNLHDLATDFSIQLEDSRHHFSNTIKVSDYALINGPGNFYQPLLQTVRIPLSAFQKVNLKSLHGVKFIFNHSPSGDIYLANIRAHRQAGHGMDAGAYLQHRHYAAPKIFKKPQPIIISKRFNTIKIAKKRDLKGFNTIEIILTSQEPFPVLNRLPILTIGNKQFRLSRYNDYSLKEIIFTISENDYRNLHQNAEITLEDGKTWQFGTFKNGK